MAYSPRSVQEAPLHRLLHALTPRSLPFHEVATLLMLCSQAETRNRTCPEAFSSPLCRGRLLGVLRASKVRARVELRAQTTPMPRVGFFGRKWMCVLCHLHLIGTVSESLGDSIRYSWETNTLPALLKTGYSTPSSHRCGATCPHCIVSHCSACFPTRRSCTTVYPKGGVLQLWNSITTMKQTEI